MDINHKDKTIEISTLEPFGQLLLELMHGRSLDQRVLNVQMYIGAVLVEAYLSSVVDSFENYGPDNYMELLNTDIATDMANKAERYARLNPVPIKFNEEHFDGLSEISKREVIDLPQLHVELEIETVAAEIGYVSESGRIISEVDVTMVQEEIEQAEAAKKLIGIIKKMKEN